MDALVNSFGPSGSSAGLVWGPLAGRTVPRDVSPTFGDWDVFLPDIGEFTGTPPVDVLTMTDDSWYVIPGPWDGSPHDDGSWIPVESHPGILPDFDRDGIVDLAVETDDRHLLITWGPVERWSGPADVDVALCRSGEPGPSLSWYNDANLPGDIDGDGAPELSFRPMGADGDDCGDFTATLPRAGVVDPSVSDPNVWNGVTTGAVPIGDWNGDGLPEALQGVARPFLDTEPFAVVFSPLSFGPDGLVGSEVISFPHDVCEVMPLPMDLDGDGLAEIGAERCSSYQALIVHSNVDSVVTPPEEGYEADYPRAFVQGGRGYFPVPTYTVYGVFDLGPATPL